MKLLPKEDCPLDAISDCILMNEMMFDKVTVEILSSDYSPYYRFKGYITRYKVTLPDGSIHMDSVELIEPIATGLYKPNN